VSESLREKLARLRREEVPAPGVRERLAARAARAPAPELPERLVREDGILARTTAAGLAQRHGSLLLSDALDADRIVLAREARDERIAAFDPGAALYLDTETTGLSGGSGTYVWLVGLGRFEAGRFCVWQGFLSEPGEERTLLELVAQRIRAAAYVVSFFGKSFDRHRLEDKMRLHGVAPPFAEKAHLDLYWPLRRRHRGRFGDCRLRTLEQQLCGVEREDDLPGSFAPAAWFDFLHGRPHRLEGVFQHNLDDVKSLATLLAHLGREVPSIAGSTVPVEEKQP
jgi:uncharacterized protein YprB with RNaseH-like and TPR domain